MKSQSEFTTCSDNKSGPSPRPDASANQQQPHPVAIQSIPADRTHYEFTIAEHLQVQREIEDRAHRFWSQKGSAPNAFNDWLKAENEVLAEFIKERTHHQPVSPLPKVTQSKAGGTWSLLSVIRTQHAAMSKLESTAPALQHTL